MVKAMLLRRNINAFCIFTEYQCITIKDETVWI